MLLASVADSLKALSSEFLSCSHYLLATGVDDPGKLFNGYTVAVESKDYCPYGPRGPGVDEDRYPPAKAGKLARISRINLATGERYPDQWFFKTKCDGPD